MPEPTSSRLTRAQVRELDRLAIEEYGLPGVVLMENAGAGAARIALDMLRERAGRRVEILCGPGNNGGDGWVVARHLANAGCDVRVTSFVGVEALRGDAAIHARVALRMGILHATVGAADARFDVLARARARKGADLIVDALLGTGASGAPRGNIARAIEALAPLEPGGPPILALDLPSGFDADTGQRVGACVRADVTATFAAEKAGFAAPGAADWLGRVQVVDIGVPRALFARVVSAD